ncbi:MAG: GTP cyclohydrolase II [Acidipila sp.]|nr:GTP cyclohydrolase II [Acidipila sp.]
MSKKKASRGASRPARKAARKRGPAARALPKIVAQAALPSRFGRFTILGIEDGKGKDEAVVLLRGKVDGAAAPLVRIHSQCLTGDVFCSERCDCRGQLELALEKIGRAPSGLLLYLPQEGRGIGLMNKLKAYQLQDQGRDTVEANNDLGFAADSRNYQFPAAILRLLGVRAVRLLSNNPEKVRQLEEGGVRVIERVPCQPPVLDSSRAYLRTKKAKLGHVLSGL